MAQYAPSPEGLDIGDYTASYDRTGVYPVAEADLIVQSVDVYLGAGVSNRVCVYAAVSDETMAAAPLVVDLGVVTNSGGAPAFITAVAPPGSIIPEGAYPAITVRQGASIAIVGDGEFPHGNCIAAWRGFNSEASINTPFPSTSIGDDTFSQPFRIPYTRLNFVEVAPEIVSINDGDPIVVGEPLSVVTSLFEPVGMTIGGVSVQGFEQVDPDNYTGVMPDFADGIEYPFMGTVQAQGTDAEDPPNAPTLNVTLQLPAGFASVLYGTLSEDSTSLAAQIEGGTIEPGDTHYYPSDAITIYSNSEYSGAETGTIETWLHKASGVLVQVIIINGYPLTPGGRRITPLPIAALPIRPLPIEVDPI
jgi:hypothetical protein